MTTGHALKTQGQQDSLLMLLDDDRAIFDRIITAYPPGTELSINDVRDQLDEAGVPVKARGGLFSRAVHAGLLEPRVVVIGGQRVHVTVPSTGESAHHAHVRIYTRTTKEPQA